jgi:ketosteroid isomerase-like protein
VAAGPTVNAAAHWKEEMVRYRLLGGVLCLVLVVTGCASGGLEGYKAKDNDEALIVATLLKIPNGIKAKSVEVVMQAYADELYVGNFNKYLGVATDTSGARIGKAQLRQAYTQVFKAVKDISMNVNDFRLVVQGNRAVAEGTTELFVKVEAGRKESRDNVYRNEVTWTMKRGPMGWRVYEEIFH